MACEILVPPLHNVPGLGTRETRSLFSRREHEELAAQVNPDSTGLFTREFEDLLRKEPSRADARWERESKSGCSSRSLDFLPRHSKAGREDHESLVPRCQPHVPLNPPEPWQNAAKRLTRDLVVRQRIELINLLEILQA